MVGVHENIRNIWIKSGLSQQDLAERINAKYPDDRISVAGVSKVMAGAASNPTQKTLEKIAYGLGVEVKDFFLDNTDVSSKLAMQRLDTLSPEIIEALGDKSKTEYILLGLSFAKTDLSPIEIDHIITAYKDIKNKLKRA